MAVFSLPGLLLVLIVTCSFTFSKAQDDNETNSTETTTTTVAPSSIAGDPITWWGNRRVEFDLPLSKITTLLRMPDFEVSAAPFQGTGGEQWIGRVVIKSTATGENLLQVDAIRDVSKFDRDTIQHQSRYSWETMIPIVSSGPHTFVDNQFVLPGTGSPATYSKLSCKFKRFEACREAIVIFGRFARVMIVSSSAKAWYGDVAAALENIHLDLDVFDFTNTTFLDGPLPEMWGIRPMTATTEKLIKDISYPYLPAPAPAPSVKGSTGLGEESSAIGRCNNSACTSIAVQ